MNTVKFNMKKALANPELVVYRNGEKPKEWHWFKKARQNDDCIYSVNKDGDARGCKKNGFYIDKYEKNQYDLLLLSEPKRKPAKKK